MLPKQPFGAKTENLPEFIVLFSHDGSSRRPARPETWWEASEKNPFTLRVQCPASRLWSNMRQAFSAGPTAAVTADAECAFGEAVGVCLRRIRAWRAPPNWSLFQWREEIEGHALAAACDAQKAYDPTRCVPLGAFIYRRVMARVLTRYRQEWSYAQRCVCELGGEDGECAQCAAPAVADHADLEAALASLSTAQRWLVEQLFWQERTESALAAVLGLSQRAVSKRKQVLLGVLRRWLEDRAAAAKSRF